MFFHGVVVDDVPAGGVVGAIDNQIILVEQSCIVGRDEGMLIDVYVWIDIPQCVFQRSGLVGADRASFVPDLSMQIRHIYFVGVEKADRAHSCSSQVQSHWAADAS